MAADSDRAEQAIYDRVVKLAEDASPEDLDKLSLAVERVKFGAQGGDYMNLLTYSGAYDQHYHQHPHDVPRGERPEVGFGREGDPQAAP